MVKTQLTNEQGSNAVTNFNKRILKSPDYKDGENYKQIEYDDPLIILYLKTRPSNLRDGTKPKKVKMLDVFWGPMFNNSWIYLYPKLVLDYMGYASMTDFHREVLVGRSEGSSSKKYTEKRYEENIDYKELLAGDSLILASENFWGNPRNKNDEQKRGRKPKYYAATGRALKKMVMCAEFNHFLFTLNLK